MTTKAEYWTNASVRALMQDEEGDPAHVITHKAIHLFAQGFVSGQLVASDRAFRGKLKEKRSGPQSDLIASERLDMSTMEVSYIVLSRSRRPGFSLPFFSRVSLRAAANTLRGLGYRVGLTKVTAGRP
jgi:uncharacterized protein (TIGR04141 family)